MWFLAAQQQFNQNAAKIEKEIEEITDINIALKDEADYINKKYGDTLKNDEGLRDALWAQFEKTLVKDEATGIIKKTPISLEEFYEFQLAPRVEAAQSNQNAAAEKAAAEKAAAEKAAAEKAAAERLVNKSEPTVQIFMSHQLIIIKIKTQRTLSGIVL